MKVLIIFIIRAVDLVLITGWKGWSENIIPVWAGLIKILLHLIAISVQKYVCLHKFLLGFPKNQPYLSLTWNGH